MTPPPAFAAWLQSEREPALDLDRATAHGGVPRLFFLHMPKTAGTSLRHALEAQFHAQYRVYDYGPDEYLTDSKVVAAHHGNDFTALTRALLDRPRWLVAGHLNARNYAELFGKVPCVTFLREPFARSVSEYRHRQRHLGYREDFGTFIRTARFRNTMTRMLDGIDIAQFDFVGLTETYASDLALLARLSGLLLPHVHTNTAEPVAPAAFARYRAEFLSLNSADVALYRHIQARGPVAGLARCWV